MKTTVMELLIMLSGILGSVPALANPPEPIPQVRAGSIERLPLFHSEFIEARNVDVWLPAGYSRSKHYNVLYMHDGQMLYDANTTWNKQAWMVDQAVTRLANAGLIPDTIVVGIWNNPALRHSEFFPAKAVALIAPPWHDRFLEEGLHQKMLADQYLRFLVTELKPAIDQKYSTRPDRDHTFLMGSSMGGLISLYALSEYPEVFGGAACLSTHWVGGYQANAAIPLALLNYLQAHLPSPSEHRIYMDHGTETLDALYQIPQQLVDQLVRDHGYDDSHFMTRVFPGAAHTETDWSKRLDLPLQFILAGKVGS